MNNPAGIGLCEARRRRDGLSLFALSEEPWWGRMLPPIFPGLLFAMVWRDYIRTKRPQAVADLAELERQLPA